MLWQLFIVFLATAAASEDEDEIHSPDCMSLTHQECEYEKIPDLPGNGEELEVFCEFAMQYFDCADRVLSSCPDNETHIIRLEREKAASVRRICNEDPLLRTDVASILPCFKENRERLGRCDISLLTLYQVSFFAALNELEITDIDSICLDVLYNFGIIAATTGQFCGDVARDVVVNVLQGFEVPFESCPAGVKDKVPDIAEVTQREVKKVNSVEEKLKKKK